MHHAPLDGIRYSTGQTDECLDEEAPTTGIRNGNEEYLTCANESFVSAVFFQSDPEDGVRGIKIECSNGEESDWLGLSTSDFESAECSGGWTEMYTSPTDDENGYAANLYLLCYNEDRGYPDGEYLGPFW